MDIKEIEKKLKKELDKNRYEHTIGVMHTAACLAMKYEVDLSKAMLAGLLHDCTKCLSKEEHLKICKDNDIVVSSMEMENHQLLHQKTGSVIAKQVYGIDDFEILHAISVHTTGQEEMSMLDKIIFVADYIEPGRDKAAHLPELRKEAFEDIDACVADILYDTIHYLNSKNRAIDSSTSHVYEYYRQFEKEQPWK